MPVFEQAMHFPHPVGVMFDFFCRPATLVTISPPELHMQLVEGPEKIVLGSKITFKGRRWGLSQTIVSQITVFEPDTKFVDVMVKGPFKKWEHTHRFEATEDGTRVTDHIEYERPGGLLGLVATESLVRSDLEKIFAFRIQKLGEVMGGKKC
jgi:ligand-binding SRPBCC domain-containing protein